MADGEHGPTDEQVEQVVGNLLRIGVVVAALVVAVGAVVYLIHHGNEPPDPPVQQAYDPKNNQTDPVDHPTSIVQIIQETLEGRGRGLIALGLVLLIATPVARVVFSVFAFGAQRDYTYVVITLIVLAVLLYSLFYGRHP